jgi:hypothetical protein
MAVRVLKRRSLRAPADPAGQPAAAPAPPAAVAVKLKPRKKAVKVPPRMFARWAVCDGGLKRVAVFEYRDRPAADAKLADLLERKVGGYFLQLVKEPRPDGGPAGA